jgi:hypothetical protein
VHPVAPRAAAGRFRRSPRRGTASSLINRAPEAPRPRRTPRRPQPVAEGARPPPISPPNAPQRAVRRRARWGARSAAGPRQHAPVRRGLPSRFTPGRAANSRGRLPEWLVAAVVIDQPSTDLTTPGGPRPPVFDRRRRRPPAGGPVAHGRPPPQPRPRRNRGHACPTSGLTARKRDRSRSPPARVGRGAVAPAWLRPGAPRGGVSIGLASIEGLGGDFSPLTIPEHRIVLPNGRRSHDPEFIFCKKSILYGTAKAMRARGPKRVRRVPGWPWKKGGEEGSRDPPGGGEWPPTVTGVT